jgi:hypothetical protein
MKRMRREVASLANAPMDVDATTEVKLNALAQEKGLTGLSLRSACLQVSRWLVEALSKEGMSSDVLAKRMHAGNLGQHTVVPQEHVKLANALLQQWVELERRNWSPVLACEGPMQSEASSSQKRPFEAEDPSHIAAKVAANRLWIECMRAASISTTESIFFLDAFETKEGFSLRTTKALHDAGFQHLFMANPDTGVCQAAVNQGVCCFHGMWEDAAAAWRTWRFAGFYLDLCCGTWDFVQKQVLLAMELAAPKCVLALTVLPRCYSGTSQLQRSFRLHDLFRRKGWIPGKGDADLDISSLIYMAEKRGVCQQVCTQVWRNF